MTVAQFKHVGYTSVWNFLDMPGTVLPVDSVRKGYKPPDDVQQHFRSDEDAKIWALRRFSDDAGES